jgi:AcrR family transcriptional regulator
MPRKADRELEGRIVEAACRLWSEKGEIALTMRNVARAARTTTPTVYQRFRDKAGLLALLRRRFLEDAVAELSPGRTTLATCRLFLDYAARNPNQYRLLTSDWAVRLSKKDPKPVFEMIKARLAKDLGGKPEHHRRLALAMGFVAHGAATMLLAPGVSRGISAELREVCLETCKSLIEKGSPSRSKRKRAA